MVLASQNMVTTVFSRCLISPCNNINNNNNNNNNDNNNNNNIIIIIIIIIQWTCWNPVNTVTNGPKKIGRNSDVTVFPRWP